MDVQGAELEVLKGFGDMIHEVKLIILEASLSENYIGGCTFAGVDEFLRIKKFSLDCTDRFGEDRPKQRWPTKLMKKYSSDFNCIYLNERNAENR